MNRLFLLLFGMVTFVAHAQVPDYVPTEGLVGYWLLDGDANDESENGNHGTIFGAEATADRLGNPNSALHFNVSSGGGWGAAQDRVVISNPTIPDYNSFTMSSWVKLEPKPSPFSNRPHSIMGRWDGNGASVFRHQLNYDGDITTQLDGGDSEYVFVAGSISYDVWSHVIITYDGDTLRHFVNGSLVGVESLDIVINTSSTDLTFGEIHMGNGHWYLFSGTIDDCGYWSRVLSESEITALYNEQPSIPGCTDSTACNYKEEANEDDGSCTYPPFGLTDCEAGGAACGEGTVWDSASQSCLAWNDCPSDLDGDGVTGVSDLMHLLADFGTDCPIEANEWTCGDPVLYHGYNYETVLIGEQCWFAENLRTEQYQNGDTIPTELNDYTWGTATYGAVSHYGADGLVLFGSDDPILNAQLYGLLYNGFATQDERGLCPTSWSIPSDEQWMELEYHLGMDSTEVAGNNYRGDKAPMIKNNSTDIPAWNGTNATGWSGAPGGARAQIEGSYFEESLVGYYWGFDANWNGGSIPYRALGGGDGIYRWWRHPTAGFSVRCVAD